MRNGSKNKYESKTEETTANIMPTMTHIPGPILFINIMHNIYILQHKYIINKIFYIIIYIYNFRLQVQYSSTEALHHCLDCIQGLPDEGGCQTSMKLSVKGALQVSIHLHSNALPPVLSPGPYATPDTRDQRNSSLRLSCPASDYAIYVVISDSTSLLQSLPASSSHLAELGPHWAVICCHVKLSAVSLPGLPANTPVYLCFSSVNFVPLSSSAGLFNSS